MNTPHNVPIGAGREAPLAPFNGYSWFGVQVGFAGLMTVGHWGEYQRPWLVVLAVLMSGVVAGIPLSARWARTAVGRIAVLGWFAIVALVGSQIQSPVEELSVLWPTTSASLAAGLLAMVGMWRLAWGTAAILLAQALLWGTSRELSETLAIEQLGFLAAPVGGTIYRILMRSSRRREATAQREEAEALAQIGRLASQAEARREYRTRLLRQVGPVLERIGSGDELTCAEREECRLVEASLRDAIRGRGLATREVIDAARAARERGAKVTLIDDRHTDCVDEVCGNVLAAAVVTLNQAATGDTFVARLLPVGRRNVATVLLMKPEGGGIRREFTMRPSGNPADGAVERQPVPLMPC